LGGYRRHIPIGHRMFHRVGNAIHQVSNLAHHLLPESWRDALQVLDLSREVR
jgi:hypothetical protein